MIRCQHCNATFNAKYDYDRHDCEKTRVTPGETITYTSPNAVKFDDGKPDFSHMTYELMEVYSRAREFGAKKYARNNWKKGFKVTRSLAAALRHTFKLLGGEDNDPESGISHIGHIICNLEHALHDLLYRKENDDRKQ